MNNIELLIKNIQIRILIPDSSGFFKAPCYWGFCLEELSAYTSDQNKNKNYYRQSS